MSSFVSSSSSSFNSFYKKDPHAHEMFENYTVNFPHGASPAEDTFKVTKNYSNKEFLKFCVVFEKRA